MKTRTKAASVSVVVNVGRDKKKSKRRSTRKRKLGVLAPGQVAPIRGIYDNANERAVHFSNFPAQRVIHETLPTPPSAPQTPVQQFFMNPGATPLLGALPKVEELGSPAPRPPFYEPKVESYVAAPPQRQGLGAETPHTPESFKTNQNPAFSERREYNLRANPKPQSRFTPSAWK